MSRIPARALQPATRASSEPSARTREVAKTMLTLKIATLAAATIMSFSSPAFAGDRQSLYPEGSIFAAPSTSQPSFNADRSDPTAPSSPVASATPRQRAHNQPRAGEFTPPNGKPDLSPESARDVDRLYDELMHRTPPKCLQPAGRAPEGERC
jgi:hypothetical protein